MQCLNKTFYCAQIAITPPKKCSIWSYKKHILAQKKGTTVHQVFQNIDRNFGTVLAKRSTDFSKRQYFQYCRAYSIPKYSAWQFFQRKTDCRAYSIPNQSARQFFFFFREKQTAVHIALQNIVHDSFSREKQTAVHMAFRNTVHRSLLEKNRPSCIQYFKYSTRLSCIQTRHTTFSM